MGGKEEKKTVRGWRKAARRDYTGWGGKRNFDSYSLRENIWPDSSYFFLFFCNTVILKLECAPEPPSGLVKLGPSPRVSDLVDLGHF